MKNDYLSNSCNKEIGGNLNENTLENRQMVHKSVELP